MPEDFSKVFTVEVEMKTSGSWEVVGTYNNIFDAIHRFQSEMAADPIRPVRLTSPTDVSIYDLEG